MILNAAHAYHPGNFVPTIQGWVLGFVMRGPLTGLSLNFADLEAC